MSRPKTIRVWAACGVYGLMIPWPTWHIAGVYAQPPDDDQAEYIYLFSRRGQMDAANADRNDPALLDPAVRPSKMVRVIALDSFIGSGDAGVAPAWDRVLDAILEQ